MAISNGKIFQQIQKECERALLNEGNVREHARAIQALTNLLLEENVESNETNISPKEWESMVGTNTNSPSQLIEKRLKEKDGNGDDIFDF